MSSEARNGAGRRGEIMSGVLKKSLASWCDAHGYSVLCIQSPQGESFIVAPSSAGDPSLTWMSERAVRAHLAESGLAGPEIEEAVQLSRDWATTITGSWGALRKTQ